MSPKQRAAFTNIKRKLLAATVKHRLLFAANLQITFNNEKHLFTTPEDAEKFYIKSIVLAQPLELESASVSKG